MLIMAEVSSEMSAELRAAAESNKTSVAVEVGRRLERLARLEEPVEAGFDEHVRRLLGDQRRCVGVRLKELDESLYSGAPNPWDMFRSTGGGR